MKASYASSAAALVSAIQISCNARLAFGCWLFGNLAITFAVLCTQQRCSRVFGQTSPAAFQNPSAPSAMASRGGTSSPRRFRSSSRSRQSCALSRAPSVKPTSSLRASGTGGGRVAIAHTRLADGDRTDTGHPLALRQVTVADDALVAVLGLQIGMLAEKVCNLGLYRLGKQGTRPIAQDFGELILDVSWLNQFDDVVFRHAISLLRWRSE